MTNLIVPCADAVHRKQYTAVLHRETETGLLVRVYVSKTHTEYRFLGENREQRAKAFAELSGGEYRTKTRPGDSHVEHLVRFEHTAS